MAEIKLIGRIIFTCNIEALTGLHIGGSGGQMEIGGMDNPVIRNPLSREPYIPGSSLRGKMRSQLEKKLGSDQNNRVGKAIIHVCKDKEAKDICPACKLFGMSASEIGGSPTRLITRDVSLTVESRARLEKAQTDQLYTETKAEVAIDRVTSMASPRRLERVPAGTVFGPAELVFSAYDAKDIDLLSALRDCLQLIEDDYLGGGGSRGSGKIRFTDIQIDARNAEKYHLRVPLGEYADIQALEKDFSNLLTKAAAALNIKR